MNLTEFGTGLRSPGFCTHRMMRQSQSLISNDPGIDRLVLRFVDRLVDQSIQQTYRIIYLIIHYMEIHLLENIFLAYPQENIHKSDQLVHGEVSRHQKSWAPRENLQGEIGKACGTE